nr:hypothetical protein [Tanacetum cinerariifolium]
NCTKVGKGKGKGLIGKKRHDADAQKKKDVVPRKKRSFTDKLAESISLTEAGEQEEERRLHETHASLIIIRETKEVADTLDYDEAEDEEEDRLI